MKCKCTTTQITDFGDERESICFSNRIKYAFNDTYG